MENLNIVTILLGISIFLIFFFVYKYSKKIKEHLTSIDSLNKEVLLLKDENKLLIKETANILINVSIVKKLSDRIPKGKYYSKSDKIKEFLPIARKYQDEGFDFIINYQEEKGKEVDDEVIDTKYISDGMEGYQGNHVTMYFKSGKKFKYYDKEAHFNPDFEMPEFKVYKIDQKEQILLKQGNKL